MIKPIEVSSQTSSRCEKKIEEHSVAPLVLVADMGVHRSRTEKKMKKDLMKIPGVVEVCVSLVTGHVAIIGMADAATLGELLAAKLKRPVFLLADFGAAPAPPVGGGYGVMPPASPAPPVGGGSGVMPPASPAPSSTPTVGGGYQPYGFGVMPPAGGYYNPYMAPPPLAGYHYTPFGGRPWGAHYMPDEAPADTSEDVHHNGCCCSIQ